MCTINQDHMMYGSWDIKCKGQSFFVILGHFLPFDPPNNPKNQNFEKMKKSTWRYHHFTQVYHKWQSYDIWFLRYQMQQTNFFVIFGHFLAFYAPKAQKIKISKSWKKHLEISSFYTIVPKIMIICYTVPEIWCVTDVIVIFHFGLFFALLPP